MNKITEVVKIFFAYLVRPHLYPELGRKIIKNTFQRGSATKGKETAEKWCKERSISQEEAIQSITGNLNYPKLNENYSEILQNAQKIEENTPVKMGGAGALDLIYNLCEFTQAQNALETGVAYGWSSLAALLSLSKRNGTLYSSDMPYLGKDNDVYVGCVVPENLRKNWKLFRFADRESLPKIFKEQSEFDFVHYDSDKSYNGRMWAYNVLWDKVKSGGVFMSDDIADNAAFMDYCLQNKREPIIVEFDGKYAGLILKS
ncbi:class I SAM-dependent methyltransferase [Moheibacter lacus]|uniref:Class I SAM-dependent methyltransferase n=1 Tax=Moheibacter lacus TaxID=2745851 RepID=A0A838ZF93_9FLAO|nr:class I SAM-dependent methyltransferase [Moheibacter lacus]MBA5628401.1 class I SAM-dependent methyltransferase [Moheibacter lacus]